MSVVFLAHGMHSRLKISHFSQFLSRTSIGRYQYRLNVQLYSNKNDEYGQSIRHFQELMNRPKNTEPEGTSECLDLLLLNLFNEFSFRNVSKVKQWFRMSKRSLR